MKNQTETESSLNKIPAIIGTGSSEPVSINPLDDQMFVDFLRSAKVFEQYKAAFTDPSLKIGLKINDSSEYVSGAFYWGPETKRGYGEWSKLNDAWKKLNRAYIEAGKKMDKDLFEQYVCELGFQPYLQYPPSMLSHLDPYFKSQLYNYCLDRLPPCQVTVADLSADRKVKELIFRVAGRILQENYIAFLRTSRSHRMVVAEYDLACYPIVQSVRILTDGPKIHYALVVRWPNGMLEIVSNLGDIVNKSNFGTFHKDYLTGINPVDIGSSAIESVSVEDFVGSINMGTSCLMRTYQEERALFVDDWPAPPPTVIPSLHTTGMDEVRRQRPPNFTIASAQAERSLYGFSTTTMPSGESSVHEETNQPLSRASALDAFERLVREAGQNLAGTIDYSGITQPYAEGQSVDENNEEAEMPSPEEEEEDDDRINF